MTNNNNLSLSKFIIIIGIYILTNYSEKNIFQIVLNRKKYEFCVFKNIDIINNILIVSDDN